MLRIFLIVLIFIYPSLQNYITIISPPEDSCEIGLYSAPNRR